MLKKLDETSIRQAFLQRKRMVLILFCISIIEEW